MITSGKSRPASQVAMRPWLLCRDARLNEKNVTHSPLPFSRLSGIGFDSTRHRISLDGQRSVWPFTAFDMDCIVVVAATLSVSSNVSAVCCHICRAAGRATIQLSKRRNAGQRRTAPLPIQRATSVDCSVWRRIISQMRDIGPHIRKQNLPPKNVGNGDSVVLLCLSRQKLD